MKKIENISKELPFTVPAGYFDSLRERVMARCEEQPVEEKNHISLWSTVRSQLAFAAGFALLVGIGTLAVKFTTSSFSKKSEMALTSHISVFDIEAYIEQSSAINEKNDEEAIVEYLLIDNNVGYLTTL